MSDFTFYYLIIGLIVFLSRADRMKFRNEDGVPYTLPETLFVVLFVGVAVTAIWPVLVFIVWPIMLLRK